jgi:hypothetical protein
LVLKMMQNNDAENRDDALQLSSDLSEELDMPDILIIDEASMVGQKIFSAIDKAQFPFVLFVLDSSQLPPVKEKKVDWRNITSLQYTLTKTLRAKDERLMQLFNDFREYKNGALPDFSLAEYINGDNIVSIDFRDIDYIPANSECCAVGYRNKLVEFLVGKLTSPEHTLYNLNTGISMTAIVAVDDVPLDTGYFKREFVEKQVFYNGEDVSIIKLQKETEQLVSNGYCMHNGHRLSMNKNKTGIMISADQRCKIPYGAKEPKEDKAYLGFPPNDVVEKCTLACINNETYILLWDGTEEEYGNILDMYFQRLLPHLKVTQAIKKYRKDKNTDLYILPYEIKMNLKKLSQRDFNSWFEDTIESKTRKSRWKDFLSAKNVASARYTTSRSIHKSQGISVPAVIITDHSFFGASLDAQYVAATRMKQGLILVTNTPDDWKGKEMEDSFE